MLKRNEQHRTERGSITLMAIALMVFVSLVIVAVMMAARGSSGSSRDRQGAQSNATVARMAANTLGRMYDSLDGGEHTGFVAPLAAIAPALASDGAEALANDNGELPAFAQRVDLDRVPLHGRYTVRQPLGSGLVGYWQVFSVKPPTSHIDDPLKMTSGGVVNVYIRTWIPPESAPAQPTRPVMFRIVLRPSWFADYQMLFDGQILLGAGGSINGRVHSNGYRESYYDQYKDVLDTDETARISGNCSANARITTAKGRITGGSACATEANTGEQINLLRTREHIARLRRFCPNPAPRTSTIDMWCGTDTNEITVQLSGQSVLVDGKVLNARVEGDLPTDNRGAIVIAPGSVRVEGTLGSSARATIIAAAPTNSGSYGTDNAPSIWVGSEVVGMAPNDRTSSVGFIADGDLILDETRVCPVTVRGAIITLSGMTSMHPVWRVPFPIGDGTLCMDKATLEGSIVGHFPPTFKSEVNNTGYNSRTYSYLDALYNNPPPMYPTAGPWEATIVERANLDCFLDTGTSVRLITDVNRPDCS